MADLPQPRRASSTRSETAFFLPSPSTANATARGGGNSSTTRRMLLMGPGRGRTTLLPTLILAALILLLKTSLSDRGDSPAISNAWNSLSAKLPQSFQRPRTSHPATDGRKIRILHLIDRTTMESIMDRWFMRSQVEFAEAPDIVADAPLWGSGFEGWSDNMTVAENIKHRYGSSDYFDAIMAYHNTDQEHFLAMDSTGLFKQLAELSRQNVVIIDRAHEMRDQRKARMYDLANVTLILASYANELHDYRRFSRQALMVHQPHNVNLALFKHPVEAHRPNDVLLAGSLYDGFYPFRARLGDMINKKIIPGSIRGHPGNPDIFTEKERQRLGISATSMDHQLETFSEELARSKICLVTSSRWEYSVQKYGEAAAAGCMMIGTLPLDRREEFRQFVVEIAFDDPDTHIWSVINHWLLVDPNGRLERARLAQEYFRQNFSSRRYVEDVVQWIKLAQSGRRGTYLPHPYEATPAVLPMTG